MSFPDLWLRPPSNESQSKTYQSRPVVYCWLTLWKRWQFGGGLLVEFTWVFCPLFFSHWQRTNVARTCKFNEDSLRVIGRRLFCLWGAVRCSRPFRACQPVLCGRSLTLCLAVLLTLLWFWQVCAMWLVSTFPHFCDNWFICKWHSSSCISSMVSRHDTLYSQLRRSEITLCAPVVVFHVPTNVALFLWTTCEKLVVCVVQETQFWDWVAHCSGICYRSASCQLTSKSVTTERSLRHLWRFLWRSSPCNVSIFNMNIREKPKQYLVLGQSLTRLFSPL